MADKKKSHYISGRESRKIARSNAKITKSFEKKKTRKDVEAEYLTEMKDPANIVEFDNLHTYFFTDAGTVKAVNGVSFSIPEGSTVGVVGESGCGKSVTSLSLMQLVQGPSGQIVDGSIRFRTNAFRRDAEGKKIPAYETEIVNGERVTKLDEKGKPIPKKNELGGNLYEMDEKVYDIAKMPLEAMRSIRGREIAMIFQEPMTSLNPVFTIGNQLDEVAFLHIEGISKKDAKARSIEMLNLVGIADPEGVYEKFPHELSGGMRQRVMIAMSLLCNPRLIIADEPTTALDVTIQAQILDLLRDIKDKISGSIMLITHDLGVVAEMADYVVVMYAGKVIEMGTVEDIFDNPLHPYTIGLQKSKPTVDGEVEELYCIPGFVPNPVDMPNYCYFRDRCDQCTKKCAGEYPQLIQVSPTHSVSCYLYQDQAYVAPVVKDLPVVNEMPVKEERTVAEEKTVVEQKPVVEEMPVAEQPVEAVETPAEAPAPVMSRKEKKRAKKAAKKAKKLAKKRAKKEKKQAKKLAKKEKKQAKKLAKKEKKLEKQRQKAVKKAEQRAMKERARVAKIRRKKVKDAQENGNEATMILLGMKHLTNCQVDVVSTDKQLADGLTQLFYDAGAEYVEKKQK